MTFSADDMLSAQSGYYEELLSLLDEYSLYAHYLAELIGEDPVIGATYYSPFRTERDPSFGIYRARRLPDREFGWKDQGAGISGDIFDLVKQLFGLETKKDALRKIRGDFGLGDKMIVEPIRIVVPKEKRPVNIQINSRLMRPSDLDWWYEKYHCDRRILTHFHTTALNYYWIYEDQQAPWYPKGMAFAYRIDRRYQLYFPTASRDKGERRFISNWTEVEVPGFPQLTGKYDRLIITKAYKDLQCVYSLGLKADVLAYRGENIPLEEMFWLFLRKQYKRIYIVVDNDGKSVRPTYDACDMIYMPKEIAKDPSDFCDIRGWKELRDFFELIMDACDVLTRELEDYNGKEMVIEGVRGVCQKVTPVIAGEHYAAFYILHERKLNRILINTGEINDKVHVCT